MVGMLSVDEYSQCQCTKDGTHTIRSKAQARLQGAHDAYRHHPFLHYPRLSRVESGFSRVLLLPNSSVPQRQSACASFLTLPGSFEAPADSLFPEHGYSNSGSITYEQGLINYSNTSSI